MGYSRTRAVLNPSCRFVLLILLDKRFACLLGFNLHSIDFFRYSALAPLYYRGAGVAVIVYDITSPESFKKAQYWVKVCFQGVQKVPFRSCF